MEAAAVDRHPFDLVFLYIQMPEMGGLEAARRIRGQLRLRDRPWLVALTAKAMTSDRDECVAAGMNDRVAKPIGLKQLAAALERAEAGLQVANSFPVMEAPRARGGPEPVERYDSLRLAANFSRNFFTFGPTTNRQ